VVKSDVIRSSVNLERAASVKFGLRKHVRNSSRKKLPSNFHLTNKLILKPLDAKQPYGSRPVDMPMFCRLLMRIFMTDRWLSSASTPRAALWRTNWKKRDGSRSNKQLS